VLTGMVAGVAAGLVLALVNFAIDWYRRPRLDFVVEVEETSPLKIVVGITNRGKTPTYQGYVHFALPEEYQPHHVPTFAYAPQERREIVNGRKCMDFSSDFNAPIYPGRKLELYHFWFPASVELPVTYYYYISTEWGLQPEETVSFDDNRIRFAEGVLRELEKDSGPEESKPIGD